MIKTLSYDKDGQEVTIDLGPKVQSYLSKFNVARDNIDSVVGHDELVIVWAFPKEKWAEMIDTAMSMGIMDSYNHLDKHVVIKNM